MRPQDLGVDLSQQVVQSLTFSQVGVLGPPESVSAGPRSLCLSLSRPFPLTSEERTLRPASSTG